MPRPKKDDPLAQLGKDLAADHTTAKNLGKVNVASDPGAAEVADTVAAGAIEGAGAVAAAGGDADQTAAGAIGGAAAATAEVLATETPPAIDAESEENAVERRRLERLARIVEEAEFESGSAVGDIRDCLRELFKTRDKPFHLLDANGRRDLDNILTKVAQGVVRKVVIAIAEEDSVTLQATMADKLAVNGDALEAKFKVDHVDKETLMDAFNLAGQKIVIVSASDKRFLGARKPNDPGETQVDMPFADPPAVAEERPAPPADDTDLAGAAKDEPDTARKPTFGDGTIAQPDTPKSDAATDDAEPETDPDAADWAVFDEEAEVFFAAASHSDDPWTDDAKEAMRFTYQAAKDECISLGEGMVVRRHALADAEEDKPTAE